MDAGKRDLQPVPPASVSITRENKRSGQSKHKKKSSVPVDPVTATDGHPTKNSSTAEEAGKEKLGWKVFSNGGRENTKEKEEPSGIEMVEDSRQGVDVVTTIQREAEKEDKVGVDLFVRWFCVCI